MKRILSTLLALCMVLSLIVAVPFTASAETTGADTSKVGYKAETATVTVPDEGVYSYVSDIANVESATAKNYVVGSTDDLERLAFFVSSGVTFEGTTIYLVCDIDFSETVVDGDDDATKITKSLFAGIGTDAAPFMGTFDGQGYTIKNFTLKNENSKTLGFFNSTKNATIKNVRLVTTQTTQQYNKPYSVQTCTKQQDGNLGQATLIGAATGSLTVENVYNNYGIGYAYGHRAGGLIGVIGAVSGQVADANAIVTIKNCTQAGAIWLWGRDINGGLIAQITVGTVTIENCEVTSTRIGVGNNTNATRALGGLVGQIESTVSSVTMNNCVNNAWIYGSCGLGGLIGRNFCTNNTYTNCTNNGSEVVANGNAAAVNSDWGFSAAYYIGGLFGLSGNCTMTNCVNNAVVKTQAKMSDNNAGSFAGVGGLIGGFQGTKHTFDGCANYGDVIVYGGQRHGGMFGCIASGASGNFTIKNCNNYGNVTSNAGRTAGYIGYHDAILTVENCNNYGDINAPTVGDCAGFVGLACRGATFTNCANYGNLKIGNGAAIVGKNAITGLVLNNCDNYGKLEILNTSAHVVDGLVMFNNTETCTVSADANCANHAGKAAQWEGYQIRTEDGAIRLVGSIDSLNYSKVGFEITIEYQGETYNYTADLTNAYDSLLADGDPITAASLRTETDAHLFALVIEEAPKGETIRITAKTFSVLNAGDAPVYGEADYFTVKLA